GGLTVLSEIMRKLPHEDVIYLADTARIPYGGRSPEEIIAINREIIPYLIKQGAKLIVMACGTSSAIAYPLIRDEYPVEIVNVIEPGARSAIAATRNHRIGVIATAGTINSQTYPNLLRSLSKNAQVFAVACPLFVPLIEGGFIESDETRKVAKEYLKPLLEAGIDTLVLGCTHYPHLTPMLKSLTENKVAIIDPAEETAADIKQLLKMAGTLTPKTHTAKYEYLVTGSPFKFEELGSRLLGRPIVGARQIKIC
ncbi:MAG: glutamate racemase, partial [Candidatus Margulisbacteria bacterium]|nr:glutamate racemase [Candidatus Margulisiibacteriota bacterium]